MIGLKAIDDVLRLIYKHCVECGTSFDLKRWSSCNNGNDYVCNGCAHAFGYTAYQPSLR